MDVSFLTFAFIQNQVFSDRTQEFCPPDILILDILIFEYPSIYKK